MPVASQVMHPILSFPSNRFLSARGNEKDKTQLAGCNAAPARLKNENLTSTHHYCINLLHTSYTIRHYTVKPTLLSHTCNDETPDYIFRKFYNEILH